MGQIPLRLIFRWKTVLTIDKTAIYMQFAVKTSSKTASTLGVNAATFCDYRGNNLHHFLTSAIRSPIIDFQ